MRSQWASSAEMGAIKTIGIVGSGTMGNGIAHVCAHAGFRTVLFDVDQAALDRAMATISKNMDREVAKNRITSSGKSESFSRILATTDNTSLAEADFVIEAVV